MVSRDVLAKYINNYLQVNKFKDYAPNGLQVEGGQHISSIVTAVSACQSVIEQAISLNADALLVHHGFFWKNESPILTGMKKNRIKSLLINDVNLFGYHLPLDAHASVGNNAQLANKLNIENPHAVEGIEQDLIWAGNLEKSLLAKEFASQLSLALNRQPLYFGNENKRIKHVAWCSGGAQDYIDIAKDLGVDAFISGEVSERTYYQAIEQDLIYFAAGHHATEKFGIQALGDLLALEFDLKHQFIDVNNPV